MARTIRSLLIVSIFAATLFGQGLSSVSGIVKDPSGAVVPAAKISLTNSDTGATRTGVSDSAGRYQFSQVMPGTYQLAAQAPGFSELNLTNVQLLVNTPSTVDLVFEKVGTVASAVSVTAEAAQVNTEDASIGNAVAGVIVDELPFESRNVVGLLAVQPGVTYLGEPNPGALNDPRSGAVDGGKSDQGNVTLDGVDVNDQQNRASFTSVLPVTIDSVQEFRTTTTNAGAEYGHSSGAQVTLITRSGTNTLHGTAYEFLRNTDTSANSFFNNASKVARPQLDRNVFGAAVGGPVKKDKLFYFVNYEGRRDASAASILRTVPTASFRAGNVIYNTTSGGLNTMTPTQIAGETPYGEDPAVLSYLNQFPLPNAFNTGDGYNTAGYLFNASEPLRFNTYIAKFDYQINSKNTLFFRGSMANDNYANQPPQFPGDPPNGVYLNNSKGLATGLTTILSPALVNTFRYGFTREGVQTTGVLNSPYDEPSDGTITPLFGTTTNSSNIIPTNDIHDDMVWTKGAHTVSFGFQALLLNNHYTTDASSFSHVVDDGLYIAGGGFSLLAPDAKISNTTIINIGTLLGYETKDIVDEEFNLQGQALPQGANILRIFNEKHFDMYAQDSWKVMRGVTVSAGLRLSLNPPISEAQGYNIDSTPEVGTWLAERAGLAASGQSALGAGLITLQPASVTGHKLYAFMTDWAPRFAVAYSPQGTSGLAKFLFGGPDRTSIRAGWGIYYDAFGEGLEKNIANELGYAASVQSAPNSPLVGTPTFTGFYNIPPPSAFPTLPAVPTGGFPQTIASGALLEGYGFDDQLKAPYTENTNVSIQRELKGGFMVQLAYVNRESHRSLVPEDMATPVNLVDPKSGMSWWQAANMMQPYIAAKTPESAVPQIAFFEDLWPTAAGNGFTATQNIYEHAFVGELGNQTTSLGTLDNPVSAAANAKAPFSGCNASGVLTSTGLPCSILGPSTMVAPQFWAMLGMRSVGAGKYNGLHITVRKSFSHDVQFDFNYTWSKCEDLGSTPESSGNASSGLIYNPYAQNQEFSVCNYDATNVFSALGTFGLPFGQGKALLNTHNPFLNGVVGGWQLTTVLTESSGFPISVSSGGVYPTEWDFTAYATQTGIVGPYSTCSNAPSASVGAAGGANMFCNPQAVYAAYSQTPAGQTGERNGLRGQGPFSLDLGLGKSFHLFNFKDQPHTLTFRAEGFNITNSVRFDPATANLNIANEAKFGQYTSTFGSPRVFQFSARYSF